MKKRYALHEITKELVLTATGKQKAELVIKNGNLINVDTKEIIPNVDVAITHGRIALVGDASFTIGEDTCVIDATNLYISPGFMDGRIHVESSMLTVTEYSNSVVARGTTAIFMDPHEIANVLGIDGVNLMLKEAKNLPLNVYCTMPSCVPATPFFETNGASFSSEIIQKQMESDAIIGLGEMMNFPGVLNGDDYVHSALQSTLKENKVITGHYPVLDDDSGLNAYIASGACCCHETTTRAEALKKMRLGMYVQIREGSAWHDLSETICAITENNIDTRFANLVSDDTHPDTLLELGHMDHIIKRAIKEGISPVCAISMATLNVAECFNLSRDLGSVSPSKWADIVLLSDLENVKVEKVIINGELVASSYNMLDKTPIPKYPEFAKKTMKISKVFSPSDFEIPCPDSYDKETILTNVIEIIEAKVSTNHLKLELPVCDRLVHTTKDIAKVCVVERHLNTNAMGKGFVTGFNINSGAVASTVAHDAHNLLIMGTNDADMALAANTLVEVGGGMIVVRDGKVLALNPLPIAGLMSDENIEVVAKRVFEIDKAWKEIGCNLVSPFMTMALLSLAVLPSLRITDKGIIDVVNFKQIGLFS